jgi:hypothetical protein
MWWNDEDHQFHREVPTGSGLDSSGNVHFFSEKQIKSRAGFGIVKYDPNGNTLWVIEGEQSQNYPNPFSSSTTIKYELPKSSEVRLSVYDLLGREVSVLVNERRNAGVYEVRFDASGLSSGVYFYRLQAGTFVETRKLLLLG